MTGTEMETAAERARATVGVVAWVALATGVAGTYAGVTAETVGRRNAAGAVLAVALAVAIGCVRHGSRNEHERGRWVATAAIVLALFALGFTFREYARIGPGRASGATVDAAVSRITRPDH